MTDFCCQPNGQFCKLRHRHIFIKVTLILALSLYHTLYWTFNFVGGIFAGCEGNETPDHAVAVVGYGTYNGVDYWLIKVKSCNLPYGSLKPYCTNNQEQDI